MTSSRVLFWSLWVTGTMSQVFGFLFAQVPKIDGRFLGGILLVASILLESVVLLGRATWKGAFSQAHGSINSRTMTALNGFVMVLAIVQLCICLYWIVDLLIYATRR